MEGRYPGHSIATPAPPDDDPSGPTLLRARTGGLAARLAGALPGHHPAIAYVLTALCGFLVLAAVSIAVGALIVRVIVPIGGVDAADESVVKDLVAHRSGALTDASAVASTAAGGIVLPAIAAAAAIAFGLLRRWALAAFLAIGLSIESASYQLSAIVNPRVRPDVVRLDQYPPDASFPSGHVAASIVVYVGLALIAGSFVSARWLRVLLVATSVLIVLVVGASRMYRGMHHPIDLAAGVAIGCAALTVMFGACRAAAAAATRRDAARSDVRPTMREAVS